jgi:hypothetical protein
MNEFYKKGMNDVKKEMGDQAIYSKENEYQINMLKMDYKINKEGVIDFLLNNVIDVSLVIPDVIKGRNVKK